MTYQRIIFSIFWIASFLFTFSSFASVVVKLSTKELAQKADIIATARIDSSWTSADPKHKMLYTYYKLILQGDPLKTTGSMLKKRELLVRVPGGTYIHPQTGQVIRQKAFSMNALSVGNEGVFFIRIVNDVPVLMQQGNFTVVSQPNGKKMVQRTMDTSAMRYVDKALKPIYPTHMTYQPQDLQPLEAFTSEVKRAMDL